MLLSADLYSLLLSYLEHYLRFHSPCPLFTVTQLAEIYYLSLHDALPISQLDDNEELESTVPVEIELTFTVHSYGEPGQALRSEEHTSELQSRGHLVCRLLL